MNVNSGSLHSESFSISVFQTGKSSMDISLKNDLFPSDSDSSEWLCAIQSLQVPLDETRYFSESTPTLFNIRRLRHGVPWTEANTHLMQEAAFPNHVVSDLAGASLAERGFTEDTVGTVRTNKYEIREIGDFFELITNWYVRFNQMSRTAVFTNGYFNQNWDQTTAPTEGRRKWEHLKCRLTPSGSISFQMSRWFLSMFYIEVSDYAQHIFGLPSVISFDLTVSPAVARKNVVGQPAATVVVVPPGGPIPAMNSLAGGGQTLNAAYDPNNIAGHDWVGMYAMNGTKSVYSSIDTRMSISLSTDLQLGSRSLIIVNEKEELSYLLGNFPLDNSFRITSHVKEEFQTLFTIEGDSRSGHLMLKRPNDPIVEWVSLASDVNVRQLRLRLSLRERKYLGNSKWTSVIGPLPVEDHTFWSAKLVFVRKIH